MLEKKIHYSKLAIYGIILFILSPVISLQEVANPSFFYVIIIVIFSLIPLFFGQKIKFRQYHIFILVLFLSAVLSTLIGNVVNTTSFIEIFKYFVFSIFLIVVTGYKLYSNPNNLRLIIYAYLIVSILLSVLVILSYLLGYPHSESFVFLGRYSIGITGVYKNPNYILSFIVVGYFILLFKLFYFRSSRIEKLILLFIILIMFVSAILSGTRAALLTFILCTIFTIFYVGLYKRKLVKLQFFVVLITISFYIFYASEINNLINLFLGNREFLSDISRTETWDYLISETMKKPLLGLGLTSDNILLSSANLSIDSIHNVFLELFINQGVFGVMIFLVVLFLNFSKIKKNDRGFILLFMLATGFPMLFQNGFVAVNFWKFLLLNRLMIDFSINTPQGIMGIISNYKTEKK